MRSINSTGSFEHQTTLTSLLAIVADSRNAMRGILTVLLAFSLGACSGGGHGSKDCRYNEAWLNGHCTNIVLPTEPPSSGGAWTGIDSAGRALIAVVTETGKFHLVDELFNQGSGVMTVANVGAVSASFQLVPMLGFTFPDGTTSSDCTLFGVLNERRTMSVNMTCTTTAGLVDQFSVVLEYDPLYDRDSSLTAIAGNYDDGAGNVLNINADGTIFQQDPTTGCVINGQFNIIDSAFNAYDVAFGFGNCIGEDAILNGSSFNGMAMLDNTSTPEGLVIIATGEVSGSLASLILYPERL